MNRLAMPVLCVTLIAGGCAISPGPEVAEQNFCAFKRHVLALDIPNIDNDGGKALSYGGQPPFAAELQSTYAMESTASNSMLFLSGGGQHGAFGAGFLDEWASDGGLPVFRVVTGISTGALQSTHAFLGITEPIVENYQIRHESEILDTFVSSGAAAGGLPGAIAALRRGAVADLAPLRQRLRGEITPTILQAVATQAAEPNNRRLYIGAVDIDTGQAVAFDMTDMATRFSTADEQGQERFRDCYVEAIVASSSVPMAALPVFIDNRMYIDGGARFGVFTEEVGAVIDDFRDPAKAGTLAFDTAPRSYLYVLVNGDLTVQPRCRTARPKKEEICPDGTLPSELSGRHVDWRFTSLGMRSVNVLTDQVYRFSVWAIDQRAQADALARENGDPSAALEVRIAAIGADKENWKFSQDWDGSGAKKKSCALWREQDDTVDDPVEFHARYMHCLIDYGAAVARTAAWADLE